MGRQVLVWDAPNIDMTLANIIDGKPTIRERPDLDVLGHWLVERAGDDDVEACVFVNVAPHVAGIMRGWILWLLDEGFRVFARPKVDDSDVDDDMVAHLRRRHAEGDLTAVWVGSNDARCFLDPLGELVAAGVAATVLGFGEFAGGLAQSDAITFVDLEDTDGLFKGPLPRINLETLPPAGRWFEPTGRLGGDIADATR
jgi:uncharacterized protein